MYCRALTYGNMLEVENDDSSDWNKRTVRYILENYKKVKKMVRIMGKGLLEYQVDDIMSDVADQNLEVHKIIKEFTLLPKEQNVFRFVIEDRTPYLLFGSGSISRPNITIYNQESSREFMGR
mgnify:CR=1 FL=1